MAAYERERRRTTYRNSVYVRGNVAAQVARPLPNERPIPLRRVDTRIQRNRDRALYMNVGYVLFLAAALVVAGFILVGYITLQSDITSSIKHISSLESQLNDLKLANDENYSRITSNVNLDEAKRIAIQELGMCYAEEGQIITFQGEGSDYVRQTGKLPD